MTPTPLALLLLALAPGPDPAVLSGTVSEADGRPTAGAEVVLAEVAFPPAGRVSRSVFRTETSPPEVLGRVKADDRGEFRLPLTFRADDNFGLHRSKIVWAHRPGSAAAFRPISPAWPADGEPWRLALGKAVPVAIRVVGPDGRPVPGARVGPARLRRVAILAVLGDTVAAVADAGGRAVLEAVEPGDLDLVRVATEDLGTQVVRASRAEAGDRVARLDPVGRVEGRVKVDDPRAARGVPVHLRTFVDAAAGEEGVGGTAEAVSDDEGRFVVPAIAAGALHVQLDPRRDLPFRRPSSDDRPPVEPGETNRVEVALIRAVLLRGMVRETGTGTPVAGAGVDVNSRSNTVMLRTDDRGLYADFAAPEALQVYVREPPNGYFNPSSVIRGEIVPPGASAFTATPFELTRGETLTGRVVGPEGRPVPAASVTATWTSPALRARRVVAVSDRSGAFRVEGIDAKTEVRVSARRGDWLTAAPATVRVDSGPTTIAVGPGYAISVSGRVVDPDGTPVVGAAVRITARRLGTGAAMLEGGVVALDDDGREAVATGVDGRFATPSVLRPDLDYLAEAFAEGRSDARGEWISPAKSRAFPDLVAVPVATTRVVAGRVTDAEGRPMAGATVSQSGDGPRRTATTADADGRFRLPGVYRDGAFLFVDGPGLRFEGHPIGPGDDPVDLKAARADAPPSRPRQTLPAALPRDREKALALRLVGPDIGRITEKDTTAETDDLLDLVPRIDPARALELAEKGALADATMNDQARLNAALGLIDESPEEAAAIAETIPRAAMRAQFHRKVADAAPALDRAGKLESLGRALAQARAEADPAARLGELGLIGDRLIDLGEEARGVEVFHEGRRLADTLPRFQVSNRTVAALARGRFAEKLARVDAPAAIAIAREYEARDADRFNNAIAVSMADRNPAGTEAFLGSRTARIYRLPRIVGRMATKDPERARRLAKANDDPSVQIQALAAIARTIAGRDPGAAAGLVEEVFDRLERESRAGRLRSSACETAVALLPLVERLGDSTRLDRCLWRAVALRPPRPAGGDPNGLHEETVARLAIGLARFDRDVARHVLGPVARRAATIRIDQRYPFVPTLFIAAALIDPDWAAALAEAQPEDRPDSRARPRSMARRAVAKALAHGGPRPWIYADSLLGRFEDDHPDER